MFASFKTKALSLLTFMMMFFATSAHADAFTDAKTQIDTIATNSEIIFGAVGALLLGFIGFKYLKKVLGKA